MLQLDNITIKNKDHNKLFTISFTILDGAFICIKSADTNDSYNLVNTVSYRKKRTKGNIFYNRKKIGFFNKKDYIEEIYSLRDFISYNKENTIAQLFDEYTKLFGAELQLAALSYFGFSDKADCKISKLSDKEKIFANAAQLFFIQKGIWIINEHIGDINILSENDYEKLIGLMAVKCDSGGTVLFIDNKNNTENIPFGMKLCIDDFEQALSNINI